jgi:transcriptional regulator with GAF, ATPase, and Fis domain
VEEDYQLLFDNMNSGCVYSRIILDEEGKPLNYVVLAVNKVYEKILGLKSQDVIGRLITEIHPGIEKDTIDWIGIYGNVALTGETWENETYSKLIDKWLGISAFSPRKGDFVVTFDDITDRKQAELLLQRQLNFEELISRLSAAFINLPDREVEEKITEGLGLLGEFMEADRSFMALFDEEKAELRIRYMWTSEGHEFDEFVRKLNIAEFSPLISKTILQERVFKFSKLDELPENANSERKYAASIGIKSTIMVPLLVNGGVIGMVGFDVMRTERKWGEIFEKRLRLVGEIFANALLRKMADEKLHNALVEIKRLKDQLEADNIYLREEIKLNHNFEEIIGRSNQLKYILRRVEEIASTDATVLILGETGTGKELIARAIHNLSSRQNRPLLKIDCATLPKEIIESELFGHEKGAFTGANATRIGRFELADGGTIFLDEIGELPAELQGKLLRVLQDNEFERLGSSESIKVDIRIIAATNRDLVKEIRAGRFRQDLYFRLNVFPITITPLRERKGDIPPLVEHFSQKYCRKHGKELRKISKTTIDALQDYSWPGNVRELENIIERSVITSKGPQLSIDLPSSPEPLFANGKTLEEVEYRHIFETLRKTQWRISGPKGAALLLGVNPETLRSRMRKLGIRKPGVGE